MSGENSTGIKKTDEKRPDEGIARRSFLTGAGAAATFFIFNGAVWANAAVETNRPATTPNQFIRTLVIARSLFSHRPSYIRDQFICRCAEIIIFI